MEKSIPDMLRDAGTNEWHMACDNPAIADLFAQRSEILAQKAQEIHTAMMEIDKKYTQQLQDWEQEYRVMISLSMPGRTT